MFNIPKFNPSRPMNKLIHYEKAFNDEEVEQIRFFRKILQFQRAGVGTSSPETPQGNQQPEIRSADKANFFVDQNTMWLWEKMGALFGQANYEGFLKDIEFIETLEYLIYRGADSDHYIQHRDDSIHDYREWDRKISSIILLTDPSEFEGGKLEIDCMSSGDFTEVPLKKGDVVFFDSSYIHRVLPVTSGTREVIVSWAQGKIR